MIATPAFGKQISIETRHYTLFCGWHDDWMACKYYYYFFVSFCTSNNIRQRGQSHLFSYHFLLFLIHYSCHWLISFWVCFNWERLTVYTVVISWPVAIRHTQCINKYTIPLKHARRSLILCCGKRLLLFFMSLVNRLERRMKRKICIKQEQQKKKNKKNLTENVLKCV